MDDEENDEGVREPPRSLWATVRKLGPGIITAGTSVGAGELIATTATGARAGFALVWLVLIGCLLKVFIQIEWARYTISSGKTTLGVLDDVRGPRLPAFGRRRGGRGASWFICFWAIYIVPASIVLASILAAVGQSLFLAFPLTQHGAAYDAMVDARTAFLYAGAHHDALVNRNESESALLAETAAATNTSFHHWRFLQLQQLAADDTDADEVSRAAKDILAKYKASDAHQLLLQVGRLAMRELGSNPDVPNADDIGRAALTQPQAPIDGVIWSLIVALVTAALHVVGRYDVIETLAAFAVGSFTAFTFFALACVQSAPAWRITLNEVLWSMSFQLPQVDGLYEVLAMAVATFGIIGVSTSAVLAYPYWCLEKGYARYAGTRPHLEASSFKGASEVRLLPRAAEAMSAPSATPTSIREGIELWRKRAAGWIRVMQIDIWLAAFVQTLCTVNFYLLGAAVLARSGLDPKGADMMRCLSVMFEPAVGQSASRLVMLVGALSVLWSTYFIGIAVRARQAIDWLQEVGLLAKRTDTKWLVRGVGCALSLVPFTLVALRMEPRGLALFTGFAQAIMMPLIAAYAVYLALAKVDRGVRPGVVATLQLLLAVAIVTAVGIAALYFKAVSLF